MGPVEPLTRTFFTRITISEEAMDRDLEGLNKVPCASLAVDCTLRIATAGALWGLAAGPYDARKKGLTGFSQVSYVVKSARTYGLQCGIFAGIYSATRCGIQNYRRKNDWLNASIAGAFTGAVYAARSRSWIGVLGMAALVSSITTAAEVSTAVWRPPG